jgi:hypothetical protein
MSNYFSPIASKTRSKNKLNSNPLNNLNNLTVCIDELKQQQQQQHLYITNEENFLFFFFKIL